MVAGDSARADPRRRARRGEARGSDGGDSRRMSRRALITGITGQDGSYLAELLLDEGYEVSGMVRRASTENFERISHLVDRITLVQADLLDELSLMSALKDTEPTEVYNLAAQSFVPTSWSQPVLTAEFTAVGVTRDPRGHPCSQPRDPVLPGLLLGDVRQGAGGSAERADSVLSPVAVWRGEGVRTLHHRQLPRVLRPLRRFRNPLQPRVPAAWARVRDAEDHRRRGADQAGARRRAAPGEPGGSARLGVRGRLRPGDLAHAPEGRGARLRDRDG